MKSKFDFKSCLDDHKKIVKFLGDFSLETTPFVAEKIENFSEFIRPSTTIFITFLPGSDYKKTISTAKKKIGRASCRERV